MSQHRAMSYSLKVVSYNVGLPQNISNTSVKKKGPTEQLLRAFIAKVEYVKADVVNLQECSPSWAIFLGEEMRGYEMVPECRLPEIEDNYLITFYRSETVQIVRAAAVNPFGADRGINLMHRRALGVLYKQSATGQECHVMNWHAIDGK